MSPGILKPGLLRKKVNIAKFMITIKTGQKIVQRSSCLEILQETLVGTALLKKVPFDLASGLPNSFSR